MPKLQVIISVEDEAKIEAWKVIAGLRTRTSVFDEMMLLFEWAVEQSIQGKDIGSIDLRADEVSILHTAVLSRIKKRNS